MVGPGLLAACISDFASMKESEEPDTVGEFYSGDEIHSPTDLPEGEVDHRCAYMGRVFSTAPLEVVTFGLECLEDGTRAHSLAEHIKSKYAGTSRKFDMRVKEDDLAALRQAFYNVYPRSLTEQIFFESCHTFGDPNATVELRRHVG